MRTYWRAICMILLALLLVGCMPASPLEQGWPSPPEQTPGTNEGQESDDDTDPEPPREYRVLLTSDIHCTHLLEWYGTSYRDRMQHWVDSVLAEHERQPFDLIVIMGDVSLDYWEHQGGGSVINQDRSTTQEFVEDFVSQLPEDVPVFMLAGNHEQYSHEDWLDITGNERQGSFVLGDQLFLFVDTFAGELDPDYHHDGVYTGVDMDFVNEQLAQHPDKDVWLIGHYFNMDAESDAFRALLSENDRIRGLFQGHTHQCIPINLGNQYGSLTIAQTGNFSYTKETDVAGNFWGLRDLVITEEGASSRYIIVESDAVIDGADTHIDRREIYVVEYKK